MCASSYWHQSATSPNILQPLVVVLRPNQEEIISLKPHSSLFKLVQNLKEVVAENSKLELNKDLYTDTVKSDKSIAVAIKINKLKELKKNALIFLENSGIDPQMNTNSL